MKDPINEEIHKYRADHARKFNFDLAAICKDLKRRSSKLKTLKLPPKKINQKNENRVRP
jgi:hypothetical protein